MIEINFVPPQFRKRRKSKVSDKKTFYFPRKLLAGMIGAFLALLILIHAGLQILIALKSSEYSSMKKEMAQVEKPLKESTKIVQQLRVLRKEFADLKEVVKTDRILWSYKLNAISDSIPRGVWLERLDLAGKNLLMKGKAVSKKSDDAFQYRFISNIKENAAFKKDFESIELGAIKTDQMNSVFITDFSIIATLRE